MNWSTLRSSKVTKPLKWNDMAVSISLLVSYHGIRSERRLIDQQFLLSSHYSHRDHLFWKIQIVLFDRLNHVRIANHSAGHIMTSVGDKISPTEEPWCCSPGLSCALRCSTSSGLQPTGFSCLSLSERVCRVKWFLTAWVSRAAWNCLLFM